MPLNVVNVDVTIANTSVDAIVQNQSAEITSPGSQFATITYPGPQGPAGATGPSGAIGPSGAQGPSGLQGPAGTGAATTASNLVGGSGWYSTKVDSDLQFKSFRVGENLQITGDSNQLTLNLTGNFATNPNLQSTGQNLQGQITNLSANTGFYYQTSNPQQYVNSGNLYSTGSTLWNYSTGISGNLILTGANLQGQINTVNSNISLLESNLTATGASLYSYSSNISGNLIATGANLQGQINTVNSNISSLTVNLTNTGANLQGQIVNLQSNTGNYYQTSNPQNYANSGNLIQTGVLLQNQINTITSETGQYIRQTTTGNLSNLRLFNASIPSDSVNIYVTREGGYFVIKMTDNQNSDIIIGTRI